MSTISFVNGRWDGKDILFLSHYLVRSHAMGLIRQCLCREYALRQVVAAFECTAGA
jgi:hypothetical protein